MLRGLLAAASVLLAAPFTHAASAKLDFASSQVTIETAGAKKPGKTGDPVASGAFVVTGPKGSAVVGLPDGTKLKLVARSRVKVTLPSRELPLTEALLEAGGVFAKVVRQRAAGDFRVRAAAAVASVRGTEFFTAYGRPGKEGRDLWVCVNEGLVDVATPASAQPMPIKAGQGVLIKSGLDVTKPQAYDWTKKLNWNMDARRGAVEDKTDLDAAYTDLLDQDYR